MAVEQKKLKAQTTALIYIALCAFIALMLWGPSITEPTDQPRCEEVNIVGRSVGYRRDQFVAESATTPKQVWKVGRFKAPFEPDYVGPAGLLISRGRWTGEDHVTLIVLCPSAVERHIKEGW